MPSVSHFLNTRVIKLTEIQHKICDLYGQCKVLYFLIKNVKISLMMDRGNQQSLPNENLVSPIEEKIRGIRLISLSLHFIQILS